MRRPACAMVWHTHSTAHDGKTYCSTLNVSTPGAQKLEVGRLQCRRRHKQASYGHALLSRGRQRDFAAYN